MMLTPEQLDELCNLAQAAKCGGGASLDWLTADELAAEWPQEDADFVASLSPDVALQILAHIDAQQARIADLERERDHWKANHDNQVLRARLLIEREDLPLERVKAYQRMQDLEARIDAIMLEFCPEEMTSEQKAEWARNQVPASKWPEDTSDYGSRIAVIGQNGE